MTSQPPSAPIDRTIDYQRADADDPLWCTAATLLMLIGFFYCLLTLIVIIATLLSFRGRMSSPDLPLTLSLSFVPACLGGVFFWSARNTRRHRRTPLRIGRALATVTLALILVEFLGPIFAIISDADLRGIFREDMLPVASIESAFVAIAILMVAAIRAADKVLRVKRPK